MNATLGTCWSITAVVPSHLRLPSDPDLWPDGYGPQPVDSEGSARSLAAKAITHPEVSYVEIHRGSDLVAIVNNPSYVETRPTADDGTVL